MVWDFYRECIGGYRRTWHRGAGAGGGAGATRPLGDASHIEAEAGASPGGGGVEGSFESVGSRVIGRMGGEVVKDE